MAHSDITISDQNNCYDLGRWQRLYPAIRWYYGKLTKKTITDYHDDETGDNWTKTQIWHWSYYAKLDWLYPTSDSYEYWTGFWHSLGNSMKRSVSGADDGREEGDYDVNIPVRERFQTYSINANTEYVYPEPRVVPELEEDGVIVVNNGVPYVFLYKYKYPESQLSGDEVRKQDEYEWEGVGIHYEQDYCWGMDSDGLYCTSAPDELPPNTASPPPTKWLLTSTGKLTMPIMRELINELGAFNKCENLIEVVIPETVKSIGKKSFFETQLKSVGIANDCTISETSFPYNCKIYYFGGGGVLITDIASMESHAIGRLCTMTISELEGN